MGQYYKIVNIKKKQYIKPHTFGDGAKLMEFSSNSIGVLAGLSILLADGNGRGGGDLHSENEIIGSWAGDNIVVTGDYDDNGKYLPVDKVDRNLYDVASDEGEDISLKVLDALCDDQYFFTEFRKNRASWISDSQVDSLIERKLKEKGLTEVKEFVMPSSKDPNVTYKVKNDNGNWECDCPSYTYTGGNECKHIKQLKTA
jgi:hypothetical protein